MTRSFSLFALLTAFALSPAAGQDIQGPSWKPQEFSVNKSDDAGNNFLANRDRGTRVVARLEIPGQKLLAIDAKKSKLDSFTDDKNTDLIAAAAPTARPSFIQATSADSFPPSAPNEVTFQAPGCPIKGASKVRIKGSIVALVGKAEKEIEKKDVSLKDGGDLEFATLKMLKSRPGVGAKAETRTPIICEGTRPIISVTLLDSDGKEIRCQVSTPVRSQARAADAKPQFRTTITVIGKSVDRCTMKVKYYDSVEEITVPFDLDVGPGL